MRRELTPSHPLRRSPAPQSGPSTLTTIPTGAIIFGAAGLLPYLATSLSSVLLAWQSSLPSTSSSRAFPPPSLLLHSNHQLTSPSIPVIFSPSTTSSLLQLIQTLQLEYGVLILSFLGAIHWGLEVRPPPLFPLSSLLPPSNFSNSSSPISTAANPSLATPSESSPS